MADICTLVMTTTLLAIPCQTDRQCDQTLDGKRQICTSFCRPQPQSYNCERPDGTSYVWTPSPWEAIVVRNAIGSMKE